MLSLTLTTIAILTTSLLPTIQAAPSKTQNPSQTPDTSSLNLTSISCFPADPGSHLPPIHERNCLALLAQSIPVINGAGDDSFIFTTREASYSDPSTDNPFLANPTTFTAPGPLKKKEKNLQCELVYTASVDGKLLTEPEVAYVTHEQLYNATFKVIDHCTDANPRFAGNGGRVILTNNAPQQIEIKVERATGTV